MFVRRGYLDVNDVWACFSEWMLNVYADARESIEQEQKANASYFSDFSNLIEKLKVIEMKEGSNSYPPSREDIEEFWKYELKAIPGKAAKIRRKRVTSKKSISSS